MLEGTNITGADLKHCMQTLDTNKDGQISKQEFSVLFKNAKQNIAEDSDDFGEEDDMAGDQSMPVFKTAEVEEIALKKPVASSNNFGEEEVAAGD